jgi:excisionase family DNA binding protein
MSSEALAAVLVDALDEAALGPLASRLGPHLSAGPRAGDQVSVFTVATLARELGVSTKTVRGAIARGELRAVKRQGRWVIGRASLEEWAAVPPPLARPTASSTRSSQPRSSTATVVSLRSVLCPPASQAESRLGRQ